MKTLCIATKNAHKVEEIAAILAGRVDVRSLTELAPDVTWDETGDTFVANARIKADALAAAVPAGTAILADDSGLCVQALGGAPGVYSSRYAGTDGDDSANNARLLQELAGVTERDAKFVCVMVYRDGEGNESVFRGECPGKILHEARGSHGFGYDPLFQPEGFDQALAELSASEKNRISHRRKALDLWLQAISI